MSVHTQQKVSSGIVTSDAVHGPQRKSRMWFICALSVLVLVVIVVLVTYAYQHRTKTSYTTSNAQVPQGTMTGQQQLDSAVSSANAQLRKASSSAQKAEAYKDLGTAYFNKSDYADAIASYNNAISADSSIKPEVLDTLAYTYAAAGQPDKAIAIYQELINDLQQQSNAGHESRTYQGGNSIQVYQQDIQTLQQKGTL